MIPVERLHYKLDMKLNKLASNEHQAISPEDKDFALNEAQLRLIKRKVDPDSYGVGFEGFRKRYQDMEFLIVSEEPTKAKVLSSPISQYQVDLEKLKNEFFLPVDIYGECSKDNCKGRIVRVEKIAKHSDVPVYLNSPHYEPSFGYQLTFATISSGKLNIYTEDPKGKFIIDTTYITYLRYPKEICIGDYEDFDGSVKNKQDSEFPEHLEDELLDIAVEQLALNTENQFAAQAAALRAKESE